MRRKLLGLMMSMLVLLTIGSVTEASTGAKFSVQPHLPSNQQNNSSYFDLKLKPNEEQTIKVEVFNDSDEAIEVIPELNRATTSDVGNINYQESEEIDNSLSYNIEEVVTSKVETVKLDPNSSEVVNWTIKMPKDKFEGILLGGFRFTLAETGEKAEGIENRFAYTVGIVLNNDDDDVPVNLNLRDITIGQVNYRNHILVELQNDQARIIDNLSIEAEIYEKGGETPIYLANNEGLRMAPNSSFQYGISTQETAFKPGSYHLKLTAHADGETFNWNKKFEISGKEAKEYNEEAIIAEPSIFNWWMLIAIVSVVISLIVVLWTVIKNKK